MHQGLPVPSEQWKFPPAEAYLQGKKYGYPLRQWITVSLNVPFLKAAIWGKNKTYHLVSSNMAGWKIPERFMEVYS